MRILDMALRNLGRNHRRTALAASSVFFAIMLILIMNGLVNGFMESMVRNYTKNDSGHVHIATEGYRARERFMPIDENVPDSAALAAAIKELDGLEGRVEIVAERIRFGTLLSSGPATKAAFGMAGDPELETELVMLDRSIVEGRYLTGSGDAVLGAKLAEDLGLKVGDTLKVVTQRADYGLGFKRFTIAGIFRTGVNTLDGNLFQIGLDDARELLAIEGAQQLLVMLDRSDFAPEAARIIEAALPGLGFSGLTARPWQQDSFGGFITLVSGVYWFMYLIFAALGAFIITNVMMMVVLERKREIGIMKSMGMPRRELLGLFLLEGSLIGLAGSFLGSTVGTLLNWVFSKIGFDMTDALAGFSWPLDNIIYPQVDLLQALLFVGLGTLVAAAMAYLPSRSASRMDPVEAIRSV